MSHQLISVEGLGKKFCRALTKGMFYGIRDVLKSMGGFQIRTDTLRSEEFWALDEIFLTLDEGENLGIIGHNGSGKSTLLRVISGIYPPDKGKVIVRGRIGALIAVGAGFHPHMSGRENIYLNGTILGMTKKGVDRNFDSIVDFADIGDFLDAPIATYSSGMRVRLGFSIACHCEPDILIVDEVLSVGDLSFRNKSMARLNDMRSRARGIIFVSHNLDQIMSVCDRCIILSAGKVIFEGEPRQAVIQYKAHCDSILCNPISARPESCIPNIGGITSKVIDNVSIRILKEGGEESETFGIGENVMVVVNFTLKSPVVDPRFSIGVRNEADQNLIWQVNKDIPQDFGPLSAGNYKLSVLLKSPNLNPDVYKIVFGLMDENSMQYHAKVMDLLKWKFRVVDENSVRRGVVYCDSQWRLEDV